MNQEGKREIEDALKAEHSFGLVVTSLGEGGDVRFVTIETIPSEPPAALLNTLGGAGLLACRREQEAVFHKGPQLEPIGFLPGSITFEDLNFKSE